MTPIAKRIISNYHYNFCIFTLMLQMPYLKIIEKVSKSLFED